jgi:hypothetical protein
VLQRNWFGGRERPVPPVAERIRRSLACFLREPPFVDGPIADACQTDLFPFIADGGKLPIFEIKPHKSRIALFEQLEQLGNRGPLFEYPHGRLPGPGAERLFLAAYHRRPTSACHGSYEPPQQNELAELSDALPAPAALKRLRELGFTTIIAHHLGRPPAGFSTSPYLTHLASAPWISAYAIKDVAGDGAITGETAKPQGEPCPHDGRSRAAPHRRGAHRWAAMRARRR